MSGTIKTIKAKDDNNIEQNIFPKTVLEAVVKPETNETLDNILDELDSKKVNTSDIVDDLASTDTDKPLSANQGRAIIESLKWKNAGNATGQTLITLPTNWKELTIVANVNNSTALVGCWHIIRELVNSEACRYTQGNSSTWVTIRLNLTSVYIFAAYLNDADYTADSTLSVWYR